MLVLRTTCCGVWHPQGVRVHSVKNLVFRHPFVCTIDLVLNLIDFRRSIPINKLRCPIFEAHDSRKIQHMLLFVQDFHFVLLFYALQHFILIFSDIDECSSNPCQNLGTCNGGVNIYTCTCAAGYTGDNCETGERKTKATVFRWLFQAFLKRNAFSFCALRRSKWALKGFKNKRPLYQHFRWRDIKHLVKCWRRFVVITAFERDSQNKIHFNILDFFGIVT